MRSRAMVLVLFSWSSVLAAAPSPQPWQGEWGAWDADTQGRQRGASVSIFDCDAAGCRVRLDVDDGTSRCESTGDEGLALAFQSAVGATAALRGGDGAAHDCTLVLELRGEGDGRVVQGHLQGTGCGYFCTEERVAQPGAMPLRSARPFPAGWTRDCFADRRAARLAWCTDADLQRLDRELDAAADEIATLSREEAAHDRRSAEREAMLAECEPAADRVACLRQRLTAARETWAKATAAAREERRGADAALAKAGDPGRAGEIIAATDGVYKARFANELVSGEKFQSENILELVRVADDAMYFRTHLEFYNGHICDLWGKATYRSTGMFVFEEPPVAGDEGTCRLEIEVAKDEIRLIDLDGKCREAHCGARGSFSGTAFPRTARRTIRYLDKLKASQEFKDAMAVPAASGN